MKKKIKNLEEELKDNIALIEQMKKIDPLKLKRFDYNKLKVIERDHLKM